MSLARDEALASYLADLGTIFGNMYAPHSNPDRAQYDARLAEARANCTDPRFLPGPLDGLTDAELDDISKLRRVLCILSGMVSCWHDEALLRRYGVSLDDPMVPGAQAHKTGGGG